jgi:hypothetical protein
MLQAASRGCPIQMDAKLLWLDNLQELNKQMPLIDEVDTKVCLTLIHLARCSLHLFTSMLLLVPFYL